jgi:hypothetical protein
VTDDDAWETVRRALIEPSADVRDMASFCMQLYVALLEQGFTETQAELLLGQTIYAAVASCKNDGGGGINDDQ